VCRHCREAHDTLADGCLNAASELARHQLTLLITSGALPAGDFIPLSLTAHTHVAKHVLRPAAAAARHR
jgi:hypothetical protein